jgi:hypothetical protein
VAAATAFALFQTIVMALIAVAWGRLKQFQREQREFLRQNEIAIK